MLPYQGKPYCNFAMEPILTLLGHTGIEYYKNSQSEFTRIINEHGSQNHAHLLTRKKENSSIVDPLAVRFITEIHEIRKRLNSVEPFSLRHKYDNGSFEPLSYFVESDHRS